MKATIARFFSPRQTRLDEYRSRWGSRTNDKYRNFTSIRALFDLTRDQDGRANVGDDVWVDLELDEVFAEVDTCITPMGKQALYRMLRTYEADEEKLCSKFKSYEIVRENRDLRENLQVALHPLHGPQMYALTNLLYGPLPEKPKYYWVVYALSLASIASLAAISWSATFIAISVPIVIANCAIAIRIRCITIQVATRR
jgi:hypothetical protein